MVVQDGMMSCLQKKLCNSIDKAVDLFMMITSDTTKTNAKNNDVEMCVI